MDFGSFRQSTTKGSLSAFSHAFTTLAIPTGGILPDFRSEAAAVTISSKYHISGNTSKKGNLIKW